MDFKFLSEEFPEYVDAGFNDAFIAELDSTSWAIGSDPVTFEETLSAPGDFAAGYGDRVAVDTVGPTVVTEADAAGTTYDAATGTLTAKTPITPGPHAVYLSVFDAGDSIFDSAVFVDNLRFSTEPPTQCHAQDLFGGAVGVTAGTKKINFQGKNGTLDLLCTLPVGAADPCVGNVVISASVPSGNARSALRAKKSKVAKGSYSIAPQTTGQATLKLTKKGKRLFKEKSKSKGSAKVTNTVNDASESFKVKLKK